jgi:hypothetical protein
VLDSWEDAADTTTSSIPTALVSRRFPNLTRLSLARPGTFASWSQLLKLSAHLSTITHLSLAYWPVPSMVPNSKPLKSHDNALFDSDSDQNWHEAANILRRFSNNTYGLKWLDLEGCNEWLSALIWTNTDNRTYQWASNDSSASQAGSGPDWNGAWSQVKYVNISQGWMPANAAAVRAMPAGSIAIELLLWLREHEDHGRDGELELADFDVPLWLRREKEARTIANTLRVLRSTAKGEYCNLDHGWIPPVSGYFLNVGKGEPST